MARKTLAERFWEKVDRSGGPDACWPWVAYRRRLGYGEISVGGRSGRMIKAHRVAWELAAGKAVPDGLCVLHDCDNPPCVNPAHLWLGTHGDNMKDMAEKGRGVASGLCGEKHGCAKLNYQAVKVIRFMQGRRSRRLLARIHGVASPARYTVSAGKRHGSRRDGELLVGGL